MLFEMGVGVRRLWRGSAAEHSVGSLRQTREVVNRQFALFRRGAEASMASANREDFRSLSHI